MKLDRLEPADLMDAVPRRHPDDEPTVKVRTLTDQELADESHERLRAVR